MSRSGAQRRTGPQRRLFQAELTNELCGGSARPAERRFGWGRETVETGLHQLRHGRRGREHFAARGRPPSAEKDRGLAADLRVLVVPHTDAEPELKASRRSAKLSAAEGPRALIARGHRGDQLPSERTLRAILNRRNSRLKRIKTGQPRKKTEQTDTLFAPVPATQDQARADPETREIARDAKAKGARGDSVRAGKNPDRLRR